ncbi:MAG: TIGR00730 family Rossman fold protein [Clostridia bacterium]|nr:TIGR00730 family Rossman fold protein [Clostridia bacterium]
MKSVAVFCGSSVGARSEYIAGAQQLGRLLAHENLRLVYGGGNIGLMREVADACLAAGGEVIGVIPRLIVDKEIAHSGVTELIIVNSMHERKARMAELSDAFVALPGGFGTIDELFEIMTWNQLDIISKPAGLLNISGFFDRLLDYINHAVAEKFVRSEHARNLIVETDEAALLQKLSTFAPTRAEKWIDRLKLDLI